MIQRGKAYKVMAKPNESDATGTTVACKVHQKNKN